MASTDNQPNERLSPEDPRLDLFNAKRNSLKSLETLWGLCSGLLADKVLNERELLFLDVWLKSNGHLRNDPDVEDIVDCVSDILNKDILSPSDLADLRNLLRDVLTYRTSERGDQRTEENNELFGIIQGVMADQILNDREIRALHAWLDEHEQVRQDWPGRQLYERLCRVLDDNLITQEEREDISGLLNQTGIGTTEAMGSTAHGVMLLGVDEVPDLMIEGHTFCFTGCFAYGTRSFCEQKVISLGGKIAKSITKKTDYLVLGVSPSEHWVHSSYGRKMEDAMNLKNAGHRIRVITEFDWTLVI